MRLIGALEDRSMASIIRAHLNDLRRTPNRYAADSSRNPRVTIMKGEKLGAEGMEIEWVPSDEATALKVLFRLQESEAIAQVLLALTSDDPTTRSMGIGCVLYARRPNYVTFVLPLLNDARDGAIIPIAADPQSGEQPMRKVRDLAANTIIDLLGFDAATFARKLLYSDDELARLRILAEDALKSDR
jgi:hypothetical protein